MKFLYNACITIMLMNNVVQSSTSYTLALDLAIPYEKYYDNTVQLHYSCSICNKIGNHLSVITRQCDYIEQLPKIIKTHSHGNIELGKPRMSYVQRNNNEPELNTLIEISNTNVIPIYVFSNLHICIPIKVSNRCKKLQINCHNKCRPILELYINKFDDIELQISYVPLIKINPSKSFNTNSHNNTYNYSKKELQISHIRSIGNTVLKSNLPIVIRDNIYIERNTNSSNKIDRRLKSPNATGKYVISRRKRTNSSENRKKVLQIPLVVQGEQINCELNNAQRKLANSEFISKRKIHIYNKKSHYIISLVTKCWEFMKYLVTQNTNVNLLNALTQHLIDGIE